MESLFRCPLCAQPLDREDRRYHCPQGHSFDRGAAGYVHLLPANQKHAKDPGDDKGMAAARNRFLSGDHYAPLRETLAQLALAHTPDRPVLLDAGCGEGYYSAGLFQTLAQAGKSPRLAGVDLSKHALRRAAKRVPDGEFAVASVYRLPLAPRSVDLLTNVFSPLCPEEFARVLRPGGRFLYVVPSPRHLWEMKQVLYDRPYENGVKREDYPGFRWLEAVPLRYSVHLDRSEDVMALFGMTPYAWKTPRAGVARLKALTELDTEIGFDIHVYERTEE